MRQGALRIEDCGLIGDTQSAALVGRNGSIDWLCLPQFASPACFAAILGEPKHCPTFREREDVSETR